MEARIPGGTGNDSFARYVNGHLPEILTGDIDVLLILDALCRERAASAESVAPFLQRCAVEAQSPNYVLTNSALTGLGLAVAYHRRSADGAGDKVVEHIGEYGYITNQTLRRLFDLEMFPARDMLRDLRNRGIVAKLDGPSRGPGVRYGRGPNFPS